MSDDLIKELDWCIQNGTVGPRSLKALHAARAALAATVAPAVDAQPVAIYQVQTGDCWLDMTKEQFDNHSKSRPTRTVYTSAQSEGLRKYAIRREALEEAAKVCDEIAGDCWSLYKGRAPYTGMEAGRADPGVQGESDGADKCAAAIRALSQKGPQ